MFKTDSKKQAQAEFVIIDQLVAEDHLLRKIDKYIDFSFIVEKVRPLYCADNGRPSVDPLVLFKMIFLGYLYGIRSERRLVEEIQHNIAYRWFLGFGFEDKIPHASTISQNRIRRFNGTNIFQEIFDEIVLQAMDKGLVTGKQLFTDSTHLKANANKKKFVREHTKKKARRYLEELDRAVEEDRRANGKKELKQRKESEEETKETRVSTTDPDSGYMMRDGKPEGFFYLDNRTVDGKCNIITDVHVTPGNTHDSVPYLDRLNRQIERFGFNPEEVALDSGYLTAHICKELNSKGIFAVIAHRRFHPTKGLFPKWKFKYDAARNVYICPTGQELRYRTTNREGNREYTSNPKICVNCERLHECTRSKAKQKLITRHVWERHKELIRENRLTDYGKMLYKKRSQTIERSFADAKELHGLRYSRFRGISKAQEQCLLTAAVQNMKKIALCLAKTA